MVYRQTDIINERGGISSNIIDILQMARIMGVRA